MTYQWIGSTVLAFIASILIGNYWNNWPVDLSALYFAAHFYQIGAHDLVYAPGGEMFWKHAPAEWQALAAAHGRPDALVPAFVYPPIWAKLLGPITQHVGFIAFSNIVLVLFVLSLVASISLSFAIGRRLVAENHGKMPSFLIWCVIGGYAAGFTSVGALSLQLLQPQIIVTFLLILMLFLLLSGNDILAGATLALAAAIKLMPAMLVIFLVMERRWSALAAFIAIGIMLGLGSVLVVGWPLHQALIDRLASLDSEILVSRLSIGVELVLYHLHQLWQGSVIWQINQPSMVDQPAVNAFLSRFVFVLGLLGVWLLTRVAPIITRMWTRFLGVYLLVVVSSPLAWLHYLLLPILMIPAIIGVWNKRWLHVLLIVIGALMSLPVFLWLVDVFWAGYVQVYLHFGLAVAFLLLSLRVATHRPADLIQGLR
ncbi:glycosyltransferase 87 family protein [Aliiroseovarius zhejiangensis]|nr:glycosyltransferase 87 family protein [Aliiroseovarius zhejiangensis]